MKKTLFMLALLSLAACSGPDAGDTTSTASTDSAASGHIERPDVDTTPSESWDEALAAANLAIEISARKEHAWTTADDMLEQAHEAHSAGDDALAIRLADEARILANLASIQADYEQAVWQDSVVTE